MLGSSSGCTVLCHRHRTAVSMSAGFMIILHCWSPDQQRRIACKYEGVRFRDPWQESEIQNWKRRKTSSIRITNPTPWPITAVSDSVVSPDWHSDFQSSIWYFNRLPAKLIRLTLDLNSSMMCIMQDSIRQHGNMRSNIRLPQWGMKSINNEGSRGLPG